MNSSNWNGTVPMMVGVQPMISDEGRGSANKVARATNRPQIPQIPGSQINYNYKLPLLQAASKVQQCSSHARNYKVKIMNKIK